MPQLFVYGTLRTPAGGPPGDTHYHERIADGITSRATGVLRRARLVDCGAFPAVGLGDGAVRGEVLTIDDQTLADADLIEGHPDFYERRVETIELDDGGTTEAWVYWAPESLLAAPEHRPIPTGDWFNRERTAQLPAEVDLGGESHVERAIARLADAECSWLSTVRKDGRPHVIPMWHVEAGNRFYLSAREDSVKVRNVARNPHVVLSLPDPDDVAIVEGWAIEAPHLFDLIAPLFSEKYDWDPRTDDTYPGPKTLIEVTPQIVRAWGDSEVQMQRWTIG